MSGALRFFALTEDKSPHAYATLRAVTRSLCVRVRGDRLLQRLELEEPAGSDLRGAVESLGWGERKNARILARELATRLKVGELVVFHHDGDAAWSRRDRGVGRARRFEEKVLALVASALGESWPVLRSNLLLLIPYYSIESWLYLNHQEVRRLVDEGRVQAQALAQLRRWVEEHGALDEVVEIGKACRVGKDHNQCLAENQFPAKDAEERSPSFRATVAAWRCSQALLDRLQAPQPPSDG